MIYLKNKQQINAMRIAGGILYEVNCRLKEVIKPGMTTAELDVYAEQLIRKHKAIPSFLGYNGFPSSICTSVNDAVVHGIPSEKIILKSGDIISVDCGVVLDGWQADSAFTVGVGEITMENQRLIEDTEKSFFLGAREAISGKHIGDIGYAIQKYTESKGYGVIRVLTGHGIGRSLHEDPSVPNYGRPGHGMKLRAGMTIAVEPMITLGGYQVVELDDDWTIVTKDGSFCSHYEHTMAINEEGYPELLTLPGYVFEEQVL